MDVWPLAEPQPGEATVEPARERKYLTHRTPSLCVILMTRRSDIGKRGVSGGKKTRGPGKRTRH